MKLRNLGLAVLGLGMAIGVGGALADAPAVEVEATDATETTIDVRFTESALTTLGTTDPTSLYVYYLDNSIAWPGTTGLITDPDTTDDLYSVAIAPTQTGFIIHNNSGTQTIDINSTLYFLGTTIGDATVAEGSRIITEINTEDGWANLNAYCVFEHEGYSPDYCRYWLDRNGDTAGQSFFIYTINGVKKVVPTTGTAASTVSDYVEGVDQGTDTTTYFDYFDIPIEAIGCPYTLYFTSDGNYYPRTTNISVDSAELTKNDIHVLNGLYWDEANNWAFSLGHETMWWNCIATDFFVNYVLSAYFTCLPSDINGFLATSEMRDGWMTADDSTWFIEGNIGDYTISDYGTMGADVVDKAAWYKTNAKDSSVNAWTKYQMMEDLETAYNASSEAVRQAFSSPETYIGATIAILFLVGVGAYFLLRKKKVA